MTNVVAFPGIDLEAVEEAMATSPGLSVKDVCEFSAEDAQHVVIVGLKHSGELFVRSSDMRYAEMVLMLARGHHHALDLD